jgi:hypothetical protein
MDMDMEQAIRELQDTVIVMAGIQARQAEVLKGQSQWLEQHQAFLARHQQVMAEIEDKLNGLNGYVDGNRKP